MMHLVKHFEHLKLQLEAIKAATNNFAEENCIGRGGFGKVYKGELVHSKGRSLVAFKRLDPRFGQGNPEFWKEISMLSLYKHENIVSLLGFCDESDEKILVYEYASRRSLDMYLNNKDLPWIERLKICIGAARGLAFLHNPSGTQQRVLHRDIKSSNILLDENWNAKISDMGLSKFGPANQIYTFLVSNTVGTIGYIDPVYVETGLLTKESDVYSLGVVLFEVLCGRLCISNMDGNHQSLIGLVRRYYAQNKISEIIFESIKDEINPESLHMFTTIAYQCLKRDVEERPLMAVVVKKLEKVLKHEELQQVVDELSTSSRRAFIGGTTTISDTPDDWVDESWTVNCVCGVNFDDGEEMVQCDECGVWVHTRCSRYVKSEKLFSCDKCKSKKLMKETEESEVTQLLVELPTKTLRMDNPYPMNCPPLQIWTEIPLEEKVHVQGIPGGDPSLFTGVSSVFGQQVVDSSPRVPRMRHAGSLPQLTSNTSTSTLMKRTSSSGGKDRNNNNNSNSNNNGSRKRNKDLSSNGREVEKKVVPTSRRHEGAKNGSANKSVTGGTTTVSSGPSSDNEANEHNLLSPRNGSDDEVPTHRTLPGLIAEIMSKGKRMTYEELCNAVLPHWPNLRKHNGERYAYSSHSQAVLDCLRNRSEWSRLVTN